jgi:hypothetical protein
MRTLIWLAIAAALSLSPASAGDTLRLICQCKAVTVNGEARGCAGQNDRTAVIDLDAATLQWSNGAANPWEPVAATVTADRIDAVLPRGVVHRIPGGIAVGSYAIDRVTGAFEETGMGQISDPSLPGAAIVVPASIQGVCRKAPASQF